MTTQTTRPVVAGTDGSPQADAAVDLAAWEAEHHGLPLHLIHGYQVVVPYTSMGFAPYPVDMTYPVDQARDMLNNTATRIRRSHPRLRIETAVVAGAPAATLIERSRTAALTVVGSRGHGGFAGLLLGSVSGQLSAHCHGPLMVVRPITEPGLGGTPPAGPVVVGIDGTAGTEPALAFAFAEADLRRRPLIVLYAWWMRAGTGITQLDPRKHEVEQAEDEAQRMLAEAVAGWATKYPDVAVQQRPTHDMNPTLALLDASERAGLLVVSRHGGNMLSRLILGSVGDALVRHALCPVAVIPEA